MTQNKDIALAILQDEIKKISEKREMALRKGHSRTYNELNSQLGMLEHILTRLINELN